MAIVNASDLLVYKKTPADQAQVTEIFFDGNDAISLADGQTSAAITVKNLYDSSGVKIPDIDVVLSSTGVLGENNASAIMFGIENNSNFSFSDAIISATDEDASTHTSRLNITNTYQGEVDDAIEIVRKPVSFGGVIDGDRLQISVTQDGETNNTYVPIGYSTSASLSVNRETIDVTNKDSEGASEYIEGTKSFEITTDALQDFTQGEDFQNQLEDLKTGDSVFVRFSERFSGGTDIAYAGYVKVTSVSMEAGVEENATFSVTFQGTGDIARQEV